MKKRNIMLLTSMMLAVLLIAGGTFAWFTASAAPIVNEFQAGTLGIELKEKFCPPMNVNPGDCYSKVVWIENTGSKRAVVRIGIEEAFNMANGEVWANNLGVVKYELGNGWFEKDGYFVYKRVLGGSNSPWSSEYKKTTPLFKSCGVCFDGELMTNEYQGANFTMTVTGEAIQATNGAPFEAWGVKVKWDNWGYGPGAGTSKIALDGEEVIISEPTIDELGTVE